MTTKEHQENGMSLTAEQHTGMGVAINPFLTPATETLDALIMLTTPVRPQELRTLLKSNQDDKFVCQGFEKGFRLGYEGKVNDVSVVWNLASVQYNVELNFKVN